VKLTGLADYWVYLIELKEPCEMKILVIDDEDCTRCLVESALQFDGHQVLMAANGVSGMRLIREEQPDIVITDILMPDQDGLGIIRSLRREFPKIKIIAISGGGTVGSLDLLVAAGRLGADATLAKPFAPEELFESVNRLASTKVFS
jgi:DNA-binding response OmpR family regulator